MSLWPWSSIDPRSAGNSAKLVGYDFLQVLPQRGILGHENLVLPIRYIENAWNPVNSLIQALRHQNGTEGMPANWRDWLLFPNPNKCRQVFDRLRITNNAQPIAHDFETAAKNGGRLVEVCPEMEMTPEQIALKCRIDGYTLVLDTEHLIRGFRENDERFCMPSPLVMDAGFERAITVLAPYVQVLHIKSLELKHHQIVRAFLSRFGGDQLDIVAEYPPILGTPAAAKRHMTEFLERLHEFGEGGLG